MQDTYCRFCAEEILEEVLPCTHCGRDLVRAQAASKAGRYEIVPDGTKFGIALGDEVVLHGMDVERAQSTVKILNEVLKQEKDG